MQYSQDSTVNIVTLLWSRQPPNHDLIPESKKDFSHFQNAYIGSGEQLAFHQLSTTVFFPEIVGLER
jgi:hypothetical protein